MPIGFDLLGVVRAQTSEHLVRRDAEPGVVERLGDLADQLCPVLCGGPILILQQAETGASDVAVVLETAAFELLFYEAVEVSSEFDVRRFEDPEVPARCR